MLLIAFLIDGQFHIHRFDCECTDALPPHGRSSPFEATCFEDVARHCYARFLRAGMAMGEALDSLAFAPCVKGLTYAPLLAH